MVCGAIVGRPENSVLIVCMKKQTLKQKLINEQNDDAQKERLLSEEETKRLVDFILVLREIDKKRKLKMLNL